MKDKIESPVKGIEIMIVLQNKSDTKKINHSYINIINDAVEIFKETYSHDILEIRLQGSVSRGEEIENVSDLDLLCILKGNNSPIKKDKIIEAEKTLSEKLNNLTGIDLDVTNEKFLEDHYDYWLIVCTDSVSIYGSDKYYRENVQIEGSELAKLWNPNSQFLVNKYRKKLTETEDIVEIKKICKLVGKDLLKSFRPELMKKYEIFNKTIQQTCNDLCEKNREKEKQYLLLLDLYLNQRADKEHIQKVLGIIEKELL